jgi:hypothetical protein
MTHAVDSHWYPHTVTHSTYLKKRGFNVLNDVVSITYVTLKARRVIGWRTTH